MTTAGLFLPIVARAYIKSTPQKGKNPAKSGLDKLKNLAFDLFPQFDTTKFLIDVVQSEEHTMDNVIPQNPLEDGSFTIDHIANLPKKLTLDFIISDTPVDAVDPTFGRIDSARGRSRDEFERLEKLRNANEPVTIVTGLRVYHNMAISSLTGNRDNGGHRVIGRMVFQELQIAKSSTAPASTFEIEADESVEHSISAGQAIGVAGLAAVQLGVI
jgi:hypothetical protein